jgi:RNA polymerase sigma-70 factor (ECF subfamily)
MLQFLLSIADQSDHEKVEYIYHKYHQDMLRLAKQHLRQMKSANCELDAEDVVQNAFVKIVRHIGKIDFSRNDQEIHSYIMTIVANEAKIFMSDIVYCEDLEKYENLMSDEDFIKQICIREQYQAVVAAVAQMDERYSTTLSLRYVDNLSVKEIAVLLGIEEKSVYTRIERGKRKLLEKLQGEMQ